MAAPIVPELVAPTVCEFCADVVEWCPHVGYEDVLAFGTYELHEASGERKGALLIVRVSPPADGGPKEASLTSVAEFAIPGVYDVAWSPMFTNPGGVSAGHVFAVVAAADGALRLVKLSSGDSGLACEAEASPCRLSEQILTHVAWGAAGSNGMVAVGQDGQAHHVTLREDGSLTAIAQWQAHELETWCVEVSPGDPNLVLTGADDAQMLGWDLREPTGSAPAITNRRSHQAGVTALAGNVCCEHQLASGSYDECVRVFDLRAPARPLAETDRLGDGAYHVSWHPEWEGTLAVAAMRSGVALLHLEGEAGAEQIAEPWGRYGADAVEGAHGSLSYGVSWQAAARGGGWLGASASFYDRSVHVWSVKPPGWA